MNSTILREFVKSDLFGIYYNSNYIINWPNMQRDILYFVFY